MEISMWNRLVMSRTATFPSTQNMTPRYLPPLDLDSNLYARYRRTTLAPLPSKEVYDYFALNSAEAQASNLMPLQWWKANQARFPCLSQLARDVFSIAGMW
jgi:hypothetical protein